eukprot:Hpha_TRINITY_DN21207_c0_g1::TRINITY_DN21207_c0_g1_i1::g.171627::m.171627
MFRYGVAAIVFLEAASVCDAETVIGRANNSVGEWYWRGDWNLPLWQLESQFSTLVVVGGGTHNPCPELAAGGLVCWRCPKCNTQEHEGYLTYLADALGHKPVLNFTFFVHGHEWSWHQREGLYDAITRTTPCLQERDRFTPLTTFGAPTMWRGAATKFAAIIWNTAPDGVFIKATGRAVKPDQRIESHCGAQFGLTRRLLLSHRQGFYKNLLQLLETHRDFTGTNFEFLFHMVWGERQTVDTSAPRCLSDLALPGSVRRLAKVLSRHPFYYTLDNTRLSGFSLTP